MVQIRLRESPGPVDSLIFVTQGSTATTTLTVALAQCNQKVGDLDGNVSRLDAAYR